jgi:AcrR family transcriptional regulator
MTNTVKGARQYNSVLRAELAASTRHRVLESAWSLFTTQGYAATTVSQVARAAGVSVDTLYATVGRKPVLLREVVESAISGEDRAVPAEERDYVMRVRDAPDARVKLRIYSDAVAAMSPRTAPVFMALRDAAKTEPDCGALDREISSRRAANMLLFASDLRGTGSVRPELTDQFVADVIWSTAGAEHFTQLASRGWGTAEYGEYLRDLWTRLLLAA